jgi:ribose 5-phosphate isomerase B
MKIALGADHAGFELKEKIKRYLLDKGLAVDDHGTNSAQSVDYPDYAFFVAEQVAAGKATYGILVCGSGIGMSIAANKVHGIRAAHVTSEIEAQLSREQNNANVLAIGRRVLDENSAQKIIDRWLSTAFSGGRHQERVDKIMAIEREEAPASNG